jgi:hypothetical protein
MTSVMPADAQGFSLMDSEPNGASVNVSVALGLLYWRGSSRECSNTHNEQKTESIWFHSWGAF